MAQVQISASGKDRAAQIATTVVPLDSRKTVLLGTFGSESSRQALLRLPDGETRKVAPGDKVDGGQVVAISEDRLLISQSGVTRTLRMP